MTRIIIFVLLKLLILNSIVFSQSFPYSHYTTKDGLPNSVVISTIQDKTGFMWFATEGGLSRFDGYNFTNFDENNGLISNELVGMILTEDSIMYFAHLKEGISVFKNNRFSKYEVKNL